MYTLRALSELLKNRHRHRQTYGRHMCMHTHTSTYTCTHTHLHMYTHRHMYTCTHACMHMNTYTQRRRHRTQIHTHSHITQTCPTFAQRNFPSPSRCQTIYHHHHKLIPSPAHVTGHCPYQAAQYQCNTTNTHARDRSLTVTRRLYSKLLRITKNCEKWIHHKIL